jgi:hypothetical protein
VPGPAISRWSIVSITRTSVEVASGPSGQRRAELLYRYGSPSNPWWAGLERQLPVAVEAGPPAVGHLVSPRLIPLWAAAELLTTNNCLQDRRHNDRQDSARPAFR